MGLLWTVAAANASSSQTCKGYRTGPCLFAPNGAPSPVQQTSNSLHLAFPSDLSLAGFIVAAAPHAAKKCQAPGCGDGVTAHVRTFLHGDSRLTLSVATLPAADALPGADRGQIWVWARPKGLGPDFATRQVRRLPLSPEASCISFGAFLQVGCVTQKALFLWWRFGRLPLVCPSGCARRSGSPHPPSWPEPDALVPQRCLRWCRPASAHPGWRCAVTRSPAASCATSDWAARSCASTRCAAHTQSKQTH
jgi:hypothetical protein